MTAAAIFAPDLTVVRRTFLCRHVATQIAQTADVLAVDGIRRRVEPLLPEGDGEASRRLASVLRLDHFFERHHRTLPPDAQVYFPLPVRPNDGTGSGAADLTALLRQLDAAGDRRGVVLSTRSGAGKTVAARKAFFDCVFPAAGSSLPPLADFLPCWLDLAAPLGEDTILERIRGRYQYGEDRTALQQRTVDDAVVLELLQQTSGWPGVGPWRVRDWGRFSPKLLLFADLNAADEVTRTVAARALSHFQARWGSAGHRVVVAYRTTQPDDSTIRGPEFRDYTLDPIRRAQALAYIRNIRDFERAVFKELRKALPDHAGRLTTSERDIDAEVAKLAELIDRYDRPAGRAEEGVVCTPLLMHLMSQLDAGAVDAIRSLTDLYDRVIDQHLLYDEVHYGTTRTPALPANLRGGDGRARRKTAMTRVAMMMHARGQNSLQSRDVTRAWHKPEQGKPGRIGGKPWHPTDAADFSWTASPYCTEVFKPADHGSLMQYGFLRRDGESVRFLHDSFIDYFLGALALARPHDPEASPSGDGDGLDPAWFPAVTARMHAEPGKHRNLILFLAGALHPLQLHELLLHLIPAEPKDGWPAVVGGLLRGRPLGKDPVLDTLARTLRIPTIFGRPETLFHQCHDDLEWPYRAEDTPACRPIAEALRQRMRRPWLRYRNRGQRRPELILRGHMGPVNTIAVFEEGSVVSGGDDGAVFLWDPSGGTPVELVRHRRPVLAVATLGDSRVVSGGQDTALWVSHLVGGPPLTLEWPKDAVNGVNKVGVRALAILDDNFFLAISPAQELAVWDLDCGKSAVRDGYLWGVSAIAALVRPRLAIALGYIDGRIEIWDPATGPSLVLKGYEGEVLALAVLEDGRVASGRANGAVCVLDPDGGRPIVLNGHQGPVCAVAELGGNRIVSGGTDGTVRVWDLAGGPPIVLEGHVGAVATVGTLKDGRVISGGADGTLRVWDLASVRPLAPQGDRSRMLALTGLGDGRVASGSADGAVRVWNPDGGPTLVLQGHVGCVNSLTIVEDSQLVSGGDDGTVRVWDLDGGPPLVLEGHRGWVDTVAAVKNGRVASAGADGAVRVWDLSAHPPLVLQDAAPGHVRWWSSAPALGAALALVPLDDGRLASVGEDGVVRVWDLSSGRPLVLDGHQGQVFSVASLGAGRVVFGGEDGMVRVRELANGSSLALNGHQGPVLGLAVLRDGRVISGGDDGAVRVWDLAAGTSLVLNGHQGWVLALAVLRDGRVASGGKDGSVRVWDLSGGPPLVLQGHEGRVCAMAALNDGRLASAGEDGVVRVWDLSGGPPLVLQGHDGGVCAIAALNDGRLASAAEDDVVRVWDLSGGPPLVLQGHDGGVCAIAALDDGRLASAGKDGSMWVWEVASRPVVLQGHQGWVRAMADLKDGRVVSGGEDGTVRVWELANGSSMALNGHQDWVLALAALRDGRVVSGGKDGAVRVWDLAAGTSLVLNGHQGWVLTLAVLRDGRVISGGDDGVVRVWDLCQSKTVLTIEAEDAVTAACTIDNPLRIVLGLANGRVLYIDVVEPSP